VVTLCSSIHDVLGSNLGRDIKLGDDHLLPNWGRGTQQSDRIIFLTKIVGDTQTDVQTLTGTETDEQTHGQTRADTESDGQT
jgi:hypothetical protein